MNEKHVITEVEPEVIVNVNDLFDIYELSIARGYDVELDKRVMEQIAKDHEAEVNLIGSQPRRGVCAVELELERQLVFDFSREDK